MIQEIEEIGKNFCPIEVTIRLEHIDEAKAFLKMLQANNYNHLEQKLRNILEGYKDFKEKD